MGESHQALFPPRGALRPQRHTSPRLQRVLPAQSRCLRRRRRRPAAPAMSYRVAGFHALLPVRDEGDIIRQCLEHLLVWADSVYIFDTGSVDDTWEIAREIAS